MEKYAAAGGQKLRIGDYVYANYEDEPFTKGFDWKASMQVGKHAGKSAGKWLLKVS